MFTPALPYPIHLQATAQPDDPNRIALVLSDEEGNVASGELQLDPGRLLHGRSWLDTLNRYTNLAGPEDEHAQLGDALFQLCVAGSGLDNAWHTMIGAAAGRPIRLTVELGPNAERFARLPLELLRDGHGYVFARPGSGLVRTLLSCPAREADLAHRPRVLYAWALPENAGDPFDPNTHEEALRAVFGDRLDVLPRATADTLRSRLLEAHGQGDPFTILHLVAHGYRDLILGGVCLHQESGALDYVNAEQLGRAVRGTGLQLAFLCACKSGVSSELVGLGFTGVGQQLLSQHGGDLPLVVATQANLPVQGSAELAGGFYRRLRDEHPAEALARARREAFDTPTLKKAWSVPVLLARPVPRAARPARARGLAAVPFRGSTYLARPKVQEEGLAALRSSRLVTLVGLPGIGKTEIGQELGRLAQAEGLVDHAFYLPAHLGLSLDTLRKQLAGALGLGTAPEDDQAMAAELERLPGRTLLLIDNAEDLMRETEAQLAFRAQLDTWLGHTHRVSVLLTSRWPVGTGRLPERRLVVPPLEPDQSERLLTSLLQAQGTWGEDWPSRSAWSELVRLLDGHARSIALVAPQLLEPGATLERVLAQLQPSVSMSRETPPLHQSRNRAVSEHDHEHRDIP